jgi:hypothetical protein
MQRFTCYLMWFYMCHVEIVSSGRHHYKTASRKLSGQHKVWACAIETVKAHCTCTDVHVNRVGIERVPVSAENDSGRADIERFGCVHVQRTQDGAGTSRLSAIIQNVHFNTRRSGSTKDANWVSSKEITGISDKRIVSNSGRDRHLAFLLRFDGFRKRQYSKTGAL